MKFKLLIIITFLIPLNVISQNIKFDFSRIDEAFNIMELQGIDEKSEMSYEYYFDGDKEQLEKIDRELHRLNYETVILLQLKEDEVYFLSAKKIGINTRKTFKKNIEKLISLAQKYEITLVAWDIQSKNVENPKIEKEEFLKYLKSLTNQELFINSKKLYGFDNYSKALIGFNICAEREIKLDTSLFYLSNCLIKAGKIENGLANLKKILEINPKYEKALLKAAAISYYMKKVDDAIEYYKKVVEINPKNYEAYYGIARGEYVKGNRKEVIRNCNEALEIKPDYTLAKKLIKKVKWLWFKSNFKNRKFNS